MGRIPNYNRRTLAKIGWGIAGILYTIAFVLSMRQKKMTNL